CSRTRSWQTSSYRTFERNRCSEPRSIGGLPSRCVSAFIRSTPNSALSSFTVESSSSGRLPSSRSTSRDRKRVSAWYRPSSPGPSGSMSPKRSKTAKLSPYFRTRVRSSMHAESARMKYWSRMRIASSGIARSDRGHLGNRLGEPFVQAKVVAGHALRGEALLEDLAASRAVERAGPAHRGHRLVAALHDEAGDAFVDDLRHRAVAPGDHRRAAGHRLDHHQSEGLGPVDRKEQRARVAEELRFLLVADLAEVFDARLLEQRFDHVLEVFAVRPVDLRRDAQRQAGRARDRDRAVDALLRRDAPEEREVVAA